LKVVVIIPYRDNPIVIKDGQRITTDNLRRLRVDYDLGNEIEIDLAYQQ
jgi:hypothetical protein